MNYRVTKTDTVFRGRVFDLRVDDILYDSGNPGVREVAVHNGGAVILPVKDDGKIIFVRQFRYPLQEFIYELPAGKLEKEEDPLDCATRELTEETGFVSDKITYLGKICTTPGFCTEILHLYKAEGLKMTHTDREEGEYGMEVFSFSTDEIEEKISSGEIIDAKTISALYLYRIRK